MPPGKTILSGGVDRAIGWDRERRPDGGDRLAVDEDVALIEIGCGDDRAVLDEQRHGSCSAIGP